MADNGLYYDSTLGLELSSGGSERIQITPSGDITFLQEYTFPDADGGTNEVMITDGLGNITFDRVPNDGLVNSSFSVTAGVGLSTSTATVSLGGTLNLSLDLDELSTTTTAGNADFFPIVNSSGSQFKIAPGNINISTFNNDSGFITKSIYSDDSSLLANRTLSQNLKNLFFTSSSDERFDVYIDNNTPIDVPRFRVQANENYSEVVELRSTDPSTYLLKGYNTAGKMVWQVREDGALFATSKSFLIPHPTKDGFNLRHGSLEGPEHGVYVRGKLEGGKVIELPDYWLELVDESTITVQLTPIGSHQNLYVKDIIDNTVIVGNSNILSSKIKCFYFIQAERKDIGKMVTEYPQGTNPV